MNQVINLDDLSVFDDMPAAVYHADPAPEPSLSSGIIKTLITQSPLARSNAEGWRKGKHIPKAWRQ